MLDHSLCALSGTILLSLQASVALLLIEAPGAVSSWTALNKFTGLYPVSSSNVVCAWLGVFLTQPLTISYHVWKER